MKAISALSSTARYGIVRKVVGERLTFSITYQGDLLRNIITVLFNNGYLGIGWETLV